MPITNIQQLEQCLLSLTQHDTKVLKKATREIEQFCDQPQCVEALLLGPIADAQRRLTPSIRLLAATILRQRIALLWPQLALQVRQKLKELILQLIWQETESLVRSSIVSLVGEIATFEIGQGAWPELMQFIVGKCMQQSAPPSHREIGLVLFGQLINSAWSLIKKNIGDLVQLFGGVLTTDPDLNVRVQALRAVDALSSQADSDQEIQAIQALVPSVIQVIQQCIKANRESDAMESFQIFDNLLEKQSDKFDAYVAPLVRFMLELALAKQLEMATRDRAVDFVSWALSFKPHLILQEKLVPQIIDTVFGMMTEEIEEEEDEDETTAFRSASALLDELARDIPSKYVYKPVVDRFNTLLQGQNAAQHRAAVASLGILCEGCSSQLKKNLPQLLTVLLRAMSHTHPKVREFAYSSLSQFAEFLIPEVLEYHEQIIPALVQGLGQESSFAVLSKICIAINSICEYLEAEIVPYLGILMEKLLQLLAKGDRNTQAAVIPAIGNIANAAGSAVAPYFSTILTICKQLMEQTDANVLELRARATECLGIVAVAAGKQALTADIVDGFMHLALQGLGLKHVELRELTFAFFANMAQALGEDFQKYLPAVVDHVIQVVTSEEHEVRRLGHLGHDHGEELFAAAERAEEQNDAKDSEENAGDDEDDDDDDAAHQDDDSDDQDGNKDIHTALVDEKAAAVKALGQFARYCNARFAPWLEATFKALASLADHFHFVVRREVVVAIRSCVYVLVPAEKIAAKDQISTVQAPLSQMLQQILNIYVQHMAEDSDKETVAKICEQITSLCGQLGELAFPTTKFLETVCTQLLNLLRKKGACNQPLHEAASEEEEDDQDHDIVLIDAVGETIGAIAKAYGTNFVPFFVVFFEELLKYMKPSRDDDDKRLALYTVAECAMAMREAIQPFVPRLLVPLSQSLVAENQEVLRNAIFLAGVLIMNAKPQIADAIPQFLRVLAPIFADLDAYKDVVIDNACSTIAKAAMAFAPSVPHDQLLLALLKALPIREDYPENGPVFEYIFTLVKSNHASVAKNTRDLLVLLARILVGDKNLGVQPEIVAHIPEAVRHLARSIVGNQIGQLLGSFPPELQRERDAIAKLLQ